MKVVFPSPDSPATWNMSTRVFLSADSHIEMPTIIVNAAPLFATILCRWLGRFAIPIGVALSAAGGAIIGIGLV